MDYFKEIHTRFPVRRTAAQKEAFRAWLETVCAGNGCPLRREENGRLKHMQLVAGDPEHAALMLTCHYDTPARSLLPDISFGQNLAAFALWTLAQVLLYMIPAALGFLAAAALTGSGRLALGLFLVIYLAELTFSLWGPARAHSLPQDAALAAMLTVMERLPQPVRERTAFLFTDGGESGWQGAKAWCKANPMPAYTRLTVEIGPLGLGSRLLMPESALARKCTGYQTLRRALEENGAMETVSLSSKRCFLRGGDRAFKCGIGLYSCKRLAALGDVAMPGSPLGQEEAVRQAEALAAAIAKALVRLTGESAQAE